MGNDGGTIARRQDILSLRKDDSKVDAIVDNQGNVCSLSSLPLEGEHIVGDWKGCLYLKEKALERILENRSQQNENNKDKELNINDKNSDKEDVTNTDFLTSLNDILDLKPAFENGSLICPISHGKHNLCYLRTCGCIVSFKLLEALRKNGATKENECPKCSTVFNFDIDVVKLEKNLEWNKQQLQRLYELGMYHSKKVIKKRKKHKKRSNDGDDKNDTKKRKHV